LPDRAFLESPTWNLIVEDKAEETHISFSIPKDCPSKEPLQCSGMAETDQSCIGSEATLDNDLVKHNGSASLSAHLKRTFSIAPMVTSEVRRSERIKENHLGFKNSQCKGKTCFCCTTEPPTLSTRVIRNLGMYHRATNLVYKSYKEPWKGFVQNPS
jgi:hypothetical protein